MAQPGATTQQPDPQTVWSEEFQPETVGAAYQDASAALALCAAWGDSLDGKVVAVFAVASSIITFVPALRPPSTEEVPLMLFVASLVFWVVAMVACYRAYRPTMFRVDPIPAQVTNAQWLSLTNNLYQFYRLRDMGKTFAHNQGEINAKAEYLRDAMIATGLEVLFLVLSLLTSAWKTLLE